MRVGKKDKPKKRGRKKNGRQTEYDPSYDSVAREACAIGANAHQLASILSVTQPTINKWMRDYPTFFLSVKFGRDRFDSEHVENALLKRAKGYEYTKTIERVTKAGVVACEEQVHVPADVNAAIYWLCNRNPQRWKSMVNTKFQQLNTFIPGTNGTYNSDGNGKEKQIDNIIPADNVREILEALKESGALDTGLNLLGPETAESADTEVN